MPALTILTHNIFWGQGAAFNELPPPENPDPAVLGALLKLYTKRQPDILCLQELQNRACAKTIALNLKTGYSYCPGKGIPYYGGAIFSKLKMEAQRDCHSGNQAVQRMWQTVTVFRSPLELTVCNLHLPSARQYGPDRAARVRQEELQAVLSLNPPPDIVTGDFNERPGQGTGTLMTRWGYIDTADLASQGSRATTAGGSRSDYIWIKPALSRLITEYRVIEMVPVLLPGDKKEYISDHWAVRITIRIPKG